eukprot:1207952-Rhodomonas_salina.2
MSVLAVGFENHQTDPEAIASMLMLSHRSLRYQTDARSLQSTCQLDASLNDVWKSPGVPAQAPQQCVFPPQTCSALDADMSST